VEYLNGGEVLEVTVRVRDGEFVSERVRRVDTQLAVQVSGQQAIAVHAADDTSMTPSTRKASQPENKNKELLQPTSHTHGKNRRKKKMPSTKTPKLVQAFASLTYQSSQS
jgi:hypothetical protein